MGKDDIKGSLYLEHEFPAPLTKWGKKVLNIRDIEMIIDVTYEIGSDTDNKVLRDEINGLWGKYCKVAENWYRKLVEGCVASVFKYIAKLPKATGKSLITAKDIDALENIITRYNVKIFKRFSNWQDGFVAEMDKIAIAWSKINENAVKVRAKQAGRVANDVISLGRTVINPLNLTGIISLLTTTKALYDHLSDALTGIDAKNEKCESEFEKLLVHCKSLEGTSWKTKLKKVKNNFSSATTSMMAANKSYNDSVLLLRSEEKRLGTALRRLEAEASKAPEEIEAEIKKLTKLHEKVEYHMRGIQAAKKYVSALVVQYELKTLTETASDKAAKSVSTAIQRTMNKDRKTHGSTNDELKKIKVKPIEGQFAAADSAIKRNSRTMVLDI